MLWEVERLLTECQELGRLPQVLVMENVPLIHSVENTPDFNKWQLRLEELGYKNYWQDMIATDYGIPQTRNRTFMVSILGDYNYTFPKPIPLKLKLKDMLEDEVDEKYFLSDKMLNCFLKENENGKFPRGERFKQALKLTNEKNIAGTITTAAGNRATDNFIKIKNNTKKGYLEAHDRDGVDISGRMQYHRGNVQKGKIQSLNTHQDYGVVVKPKVLGGIGEKKSNGGTQYYQQNRIYDDNVSISLTTECNPYYKNDLRIRKLTPKECFRLMGVKDEDFDKVAKNQSDSSLYHLAGDSIVCQGVLTSLFKEMME